ncbi:hypothetical protein C6P46_003869 [Rhodotorula mucilaginosa]|uniref:Uncharacterized protein n=1 Tax=Rhodotorula mucilaginosa TaxID=5537 RepID=A0A9P6W258_RHOMI|nr:hypothetical protein C6P46_003869 [Rhodotorula mucilaginosa]TKA51131.1 hypothetical protein B0A53_05949 [Rhodotorula sp. CCFEE 5036]
MSSQLQQTTEILSTAPRPDLLHSDIESSDDMDKHSIASSIKSKSDLPRREKVVKSAGVVRMEAIARAADSKSGKYTLGLIAAACYAMYWVYCQERSTTYSFSVWATSSFKQHSSGISALGIATSIISSVCLPFLAKFSDIFSRPWVFVMALVSYLMGFAIIMKSPTLAAYIVGNVFVSIGSAGIGFLTSVLTADLVPLKWRGFAQGLLSTPYLATVWYTSYIVESLSTNNDWRWGYGMYLIIMPAVMVPAIAALFGLERRAHRQGLINMAAAKKGIEDEEAEVEIENKTMREKLISTFHELDTVGLILLGFGWSLLLLPFSLSAYAKDGYKNPSLIAMFVVGGVCLIGYGFWEAYGAKFPSAPGRILKNRTVITAIIIDVIYLLAGWMQLAYLSSYVYIVTDLSVTQWNYFNNVLTMGLCSFGLVAGVIQRYTHRYKALQVFGICVKIIGYGLLVDKNGVHDVGRLVMSQLLTGMGGAFSVVGSQVGSQASVPHQDVALVIALLSLWSNIGGSIGSAIAAQVWNSQMPGNLRKFLPSSVSDAEVLEFFSSITLIRSYDYDSPIRQGAIKAYETTVYPLWSAALGLSFIALIAACFQSNFFLGDTQNAYDHQDTAGHTRVEEKGIVEKPKSGWQRVLRFWDL